MVVTNDSYVEDTSAPSLSNVSMTTSTSGSDTVIQISGKITEDNFNYGYFHIRNKDVPTFNQQSVWIGQDQLTVRVISRSQERRSQLSSRNLLYFSVLSL